MPNFPLHAAQLRKELKSIITRLSDDFDGDNLMFTIGADVSRLSHSIARLEDRQTKRKSPLVDAGEQTELTDEEKAEAGVPAEQHVVETDQEKLENVTRPSSTGRKQRADHPAQPKGPRNG